MRRLMLYLALLGLGAMAPALYRATDNLGVGVWGWDRPRIEAYLTGRLAAYRQVKSWLSRGENAQDQIEAAERRLSDGLHLGEAIP